MYFDIGGGVEHEEVMSQGLELDAVLPAWGTDPLKKNGSWSNHKARLSTKCPRCRPVSASIQRHWCPAHAWTRCNDRIRASERRAELERKGFFGQRLPGSPAQI